MQSVADYIVTFSSILFGLAVGDILLDLNRLLRHGSHVRWHPLPVLATIYVTLILLSAWWDLYHQVSGVESVSILEFLPLFVKLCVIFLVAAAALPGDPDEGFDLKQYYYENIRRFYGLFVVLALVIMVPGLLAGAPPTVAGLFMPIRTILVCGTLASSRKPWLHWTLLPFLVLSFGYFWIGSKIG